MLMKISVNDSVCTDAALHVGKVPKLEELRESSEEAAAPKIDSTSPGACSAVWHPPR